MISEYLISNLFFSAVHENSQLSVMHLLTPLLSRIPVYSVTDNGVAFRKPRATISEATWTVETEIDDKTKRDCHLSLFLFAAPREVHVLLLLSE